MKIDGNQETFKYASKFWSNKTTYQSNSLAIDDKEAKLASYWTLTFTEIYQGMKVNGTIRWITFRYKASSLYSLIADGHYRKTSEGFNARTSQPHSLASAEAARLGFIADGYDNCVRPATFVPLAQS
ncbi:uncharacterized skeletal organic matrix protein 5-like [Corticium candelabrum]|uniref:uncharacterized skeletal organic matrix protein 5-like n=1 Tax=Corticium candelabrum TaxID=121492 RepID=UPI002E253427|nr:uncharacterized skeletal organic matrix protein 5-like [Corticium candelabrum]